MINNVVLVGRIVRDPELRYTPSNVAVTTFTLAINRRFKNANGEHEADFINCVIWRKLAENLAAWAKKGALIGITGVIQTRHYENKEGQRVYVTEVAADTFQLLESRSSSPSANTPPITTQSGDSQTPDISQPDPFANSQPMEIDDDDLPF